MTGPFQPEDAKSPPPKSDERLLSLWPATLPVIPGGPWRDEYHFTSRWLAVSKGAAIHYVDEGSGPPVVMVHGNPAWSFMFRRLISNLSGYRRLALDHLGMGLSSRPGSGYGYRLKDRVRDFGAWMASLNLTEKAHIVVHDWGGPIGLSWAAANPDKVASLTIMNTGLRRPPGWRLPSKLLLFEATPILGRLLAVDFNLFVKGLVRTGTLRPLTKAAESGFLAPYRLAAHRRALGAFIKDIPMSPKHPSWPALKAVSEALGNLSDKPALLAWGMEDFVFGPPFLDDFQKRLPKAEVLALSLAGHWLLEDEPDKIIKALKSHLDRAAASSLAGQPPSLPPDDPQKARD